MLKKLILAALVVTSAVFAQNNIKVGARAAGTFGTAWGENTDLLFHLKSENESYDIHFKGVLDYEDRRHP